LKARKPKEGKRFQGKLLGAVKIMALRESGVKE